MSEQTWENDNRWRRARVSSALLSEFLRGNAQSCDWSAPHDLAVVGLHEVTSGPNGSYVFIVWSASFEPVPMDENGRLKDEIPFVEFVYNRTPS